MHLSEMITSQLIKMEIINSEEKDIYLYGFTQGFLLLLNIITVLIIGLLSKMILESLIFIFSYSVLRIYAGGYHASTQPRCYLFSIFMITIVLYLIKFIPWNTFIIFIILSISVINIFLIAPVEDINKPLDQQEKIFFKKRTNIILSILIFVTLSSWIIGIDQIVICIIMGMFTISVMLILGKLKLKKKE